MRSGRAATVASLLFAEGRNVKQVQQWLGHHDPAFTLQRYVHLLAEGVGDAAFFDSISSAASRTKAIVREGEARAA